MSDTAYQPLRPGDRVRWVEMGRAAAKPTTRDGTIARIVGEGRKAVAQVRADGGALSELAQSLRETGHGEIAAELEACRRTQERAGGLAVKWETVGEETGG